MPESPFTFDPGKAVEVILYTASKAGTDLYDTLKLIYLADKAHLGRFGRFIFGDWYCAMEYGPVPSNAYDVMKFARRDRDYSLAMHAREAFSVNPKNHRISSLRAPNLDELSMSELRCLDEAIEKYGRLGFKGLKELTHDAAYKATQLNHEMALSAIASTLEHAADLIQHLSDPNPDRA